MTPAAGVEYTIMTTGEHAQNPAAAPEPGRLSLRERELIALVAQGQTDAQIVGKLFITISTVRSHLDRIRDKSGCRRRADLTRLALQEGMAPFQGASEEGRRALANGPEVGPVSVVPDEPARLREDATLALLDVHGPELHRAGGVEEPAVARFQDGQAGPPQCRVEAEGPRTA
jgi:DNA-binding CsgD family transcriptional regulator